MCRVISVIDLLKSHYFFFILKIFFRKDLILSRVRIVFWITIEYKYQYVYILSEAPALDEAPGPWVAINAAPGRTLFCVYFLVTNVALALAMYT